MSKSKTRSVAAIGNSRVIPGERKRDPGSSVFLDERTTLDSLPAFAGTKVRGNDGIAWASVILSERKRVEGSLESTEILSFAQDDKSARRSRLTVHAAWAPATDLGAGLQPGLST